MMNRSFTAALRNSATAACLAALSLVAITGRPAAAAEPGAPEVVARVVELTNLQRQQAGLAPLAVNPNLAQAAQGYADVLASGDCFAHTCGPVPNFAQRLEDAGYAEWRTLGENIAAGQPSAEDVVAAWMASPGHRANILNPAYTEIGVGATVGGPYGLNWTQEFGARA